jgi:hypothetical protein
MVMRADLVLIVMTSLPIAALLPRSARADDASCIAGIEQGESLRRQGKLHDALKQFAICSAPTCPSEVKSECDKRIADVDSTMPTLVIAATDPAGNDLRDVKVTMDGAPLLSLLDGRPVSIDPGSHVFHFEQAGQPPVDKTLLLREGETDRHESVVIGTALSTAPGATPSNWWTLQRTLAVVSGGLGVVGLGFGAVFGGLAISDQNMEKSNCSSSSCSNKGQAQADYTTAGQNANVSTAGFIAGGVLLAAGAVLFFTASDPAGPTTGRLYLAPSPTPSGPGIVLGGEL